MAKTVVQPASVPVPTAPYSQGLGVGDLIFISGQVPVDHAGQTAGLGDAVAQSQQVIQNVKAMVEEAGATLDDVVKLTIFVTDMSVLPRLLEVREQYFRPPYPTATAVQIGALVNPQWMVEVEAIAVRGCGKE